MAILFGAIMLATRADAVTVAVLSRLRAAAATTDLPRPVQYYCGWGYCDPCWGDGGYAYSGYGGYGGYGYGGYGGYYRPHYYGYGGYPYAGAGWGYRRSWW